MLLVVLMGSPSLVVGSDVEMKIAGNSVPKNELSSVLTMAYREWKYTIYATLCTACVL